MLLGPSLQRTSLEQSVLNDVWVSVPVGSEGGGGDVAFKHYRKNVHEDLLFKVGHGRLASNTAMSGIGCGDYVSARFHSRSFHFCSTLSRCVLDIPLSLLLFASGCPTSARMSGSSWIW